MSEIKPRVRVPLTATRDEIIEIRTLITHEMESGQRKDDQGRIVPRRIINRFECRFEGELVFASDWHAAVSANPYLSFSLRASRSGRFEFLWRDDDGAVYTESARIEVS